MWAYIAIWASCSIVLVELALKKVSPIIKFYENQPKSNDIMRRWDIPKWSRVKLYIGSLLLFPRLFLIVLSVLAHWFCTRISILGYTITPDKPLPALRRKLFCISSRFWARVLLLGIGFWNIDYKGFPQDCNIITSNHCSWVDIIYFLTAPELPAFVSKATVKTMPFIGTIASAMQCIFVERTKDKGAAIKAIVQRQKLMKIQKGFPKLLLFPEGTTTNGTGLMQFKKGAFLEMLPVQPICLEYKERNFSPCMEVVPMWAHAVFLASQFANKLIVHRLDVCKPVKANCPEEYAEEVRSVISEYLGIGKVDFTMEDKVELLNRIFNEKAKEF